MINVGDTVDAFGVPAFVTEVWQDGSIFVETWEPGFYGLVHGGFRPYPMPVQPDFPETCTHLRKTFIGIAAGRWACAICGEYL